MHGNVVDGFCNVLQMVSVVLVLYMRTSLTHVREGLLLPGFLYIRDAFTVINSRYGLKVRDESQLRM